MSEEHLKSLVEMARNNTGPGIHTSATGFSEYSELIKLPKRLNGISILDIGAGFSTFTPEVLKRGADAYAVDPIYGGDISLIMSQYLQSIGGYLNMGELGKYLYQRNMVNTRVWESSFRGNTDRYRPDTAQSLSFPDSRFKYVVSGICILGYLDKDWDQLEPATAEAIRVTQKGGTIVFGPYGGQIELVTSSGDLNKQIANRERLRIWLKSRDIRFEERTLPHSGKKMIISV